MPSKISRLDSMMLKGRLLDSKTSILKLLLRLALSEKMLIESQLIVMISENISKVLNAVMLTLLLKLGLMTSKLKIKMRTCTLSREILKLWDILTMV